MHLDIIEYIPQNIFILIQHSKMVAQR